MDNEDRTAAMTTVATLLEIPYSTLHGMSKRELVDTVRVGGDLHVVLNDSLKKAIDEYRPRGNTPMAKEIDLDYFIESGWESRLIHAAEWKGEAIRWDFVCSLYGVHPDAYSALSEEHVTQYRNDENDEMIYVKIGKNAFDQVVDLYHSEWTPDKSSSSFAWSWTDTLPWAVFGFILIVTLIYFAVSA